MKRVGLLTLFNWRWNPRVMGDLLFHSATEALRALLADPRHLDVEPGLTITLDTWDDRLFFHPVAHRIKISYNDT